MKQTVIVTGPELQLGVASEVLSRPQFRGKHVAAIHLIADPDESTPELRIRAQVILFDTEKVAREYATNPNVTEPAPTAAPLAEPPKGTTA